MTVPEGGSEGTQKKDEKSAEEKRKLVMIVDALKKQGFKVEEACEVAGISKTTYYRWREELGIKDDETKVDKVQSPSVPSEVQTAYDILKQYGFSTSERTESQQQDPVEQLVQLKKQLDRARAILGSGEGVNAPAGGEELEEIKKAIGFLLKKIDELQRGQVYMGRVRKVRYPDGTEIEYDLMPKDFVTVKQANTMYDRVVPEALQELKGMRQDLTMFANRLLGLIETNLAHEFKKAPGFFLSFHKRSKEERERELEEIEKKLEEKEKELLSLKVGGEEVEVSAGDVGEGGSR
jgi:hypothetical protein